MPDTETDNGQPKRQARFSPLLGAPYGRPKTLEEKITETRGELALALAGLSNILAKSQLWGLDSTERRASHADFGKTNAHLLIREIDKVEFRLVQVKSDLLARMTVNHEDRAVNVTSVLKRLGSEHGPTFVLSVLERFGVTDADQLIAEPKYSEFMQHYAPEVTSEMHVSGEDGEGNTASVTTEYSAAPITREFAPEGTSGLEPTMGVKTQSEHATPADWADLPLIAMAAATENMVIRAESVRRPNYDALRIFGKSARTGIETLLEEVHVQRR